ncbi:EF-hand domain-containing protein [Actinokineospora sp. 24-640]
MLTKQQLIDQTFGSADVDGDGYLTKSDLVGRATLFADAMLDKATSRDETADIADMLTTAADLMPKMAAEQWERIRAVARLDDQGRLTRDEFARIIVHLVEGEVTDAHQLVMDATWHFLDPDGDNAMNRDDWNRFAKANDITIYVDELFEEMDSDRDGRVSKDDYLAVPAAWNKRS